MTTRHTLRVAGLALAIAAAFPALADTTVSVQGNSRHYVYYRDHDIYYAPDTRTYYWTAGGSWHWGDTLPEAWRRDVERGGIEIELDTDRPYERHDYVVSRYQHHSDTRIDRAARRHYVYYRDHDIYYAPDSRTYYWRTDGRWRSGDALPESSRRYVTSGGIEIELDTDRPYERHDYVVAQYGAGADPAARTTRERSVNRDGSVTTTTTTVSPRRYTYYRDQNIYYARDSNTYFWRRNGNWESGRTLPAEAQVLVRNGNGIEVELDTDRPYEREDYIAEHYLNNRPDRVVSSTSVGRDGSTRTTTTTTKRSYVYYGDRQIYYSPETKTYYWMANGTWRSGARLPYSLRRYARNGVNIALDTDRPYDRHEYVIARYKDGVYRDDRDDD
jgi:hypothetical protein